jgi:hypothetical protein
MASVPDPPWWRQRPEPAREKRPLTREAIVDAALALPTRRALRTRPVEAIGVAD